MIKKKKYDKKKQMLKDKEQLLPNPAREVLGDGKPELVNVKPELDEEKPLHPRHITHPSTTHSGTTHSNVGYSSTQISSQSDLYDLYDRSRTPTPNLKDTNLEVTRSSSPKSKHKQLPNTPLVSKDSETKEIHQPTPRKPEREFSIEEIVDSDDELNRRPPTPPITISHNPLTPDSTNLEPAADPSTKSSLQPAVDLKQKPEFLGSISHTKFQGKNLLILSPGKESSLSADNYDRSSLVPDHDQRSACTSPMAKKNRHARVVEDNDGNDVKNGDLRDNDAISMFTSSDEHLENRYGTAQSSVGDNNDKLDILTTPKRSSHPISVISPPPKVPLPSIPNSSKSPSVLSNSTPREITISDKYYMDAVNNANEDLLNGLGLEGIEYGDHNDLKRKKNGKVIANNTPTVTNLEDDENTVPNNNDGKFSPELNRKQSILRTPRLGLRHKRSTSGGNNGGIKLNFFKKDDTGHSRHLSDGSINIAPIFSSHGRSNSDNLNIHIVPGINSNTPGLTHSRGTSYDMEADIKGLRLEITQLDTTKKNLMKDVRKLQNDRQKLSSELESMKVKYNEEFKKINQLNREVQELKFQKRQLERKDEKEMKQSPKVDEMGHHMSNNSSSSLIHIPEEEIETHKATATKLKFWRRPKITTPVMVPTNLSISPSKDEDDTRRGFLLSKSKSTNILDSFLGGNNNHTNLSTLSIGHDDETSLFNCSIETRSKYENNQVPMIISRCVEEVEKRGLDLEGIYRISGGNSTIQAIEVAFANINTKNPKDKTHDKLNEALNCDINAVTSALKRYLRKIPNPLIPYELYTDFININAVIDYRQKVDEFQTKIVAKLPGANRSVLELLCKHLQLVNSFNAVNRMNFKNLSVVFAPTLARDETGQREMLDMGHRNEVTEFLFVHFSDIFV